MRQFGECQSENEELRLSLKAARDILAKYEETLDGMAASLGEMREYKSNYIVLSKKYECL